MISPDARGAAVEIGIFADEIGIEIGIFGDHRLKTSYRPVFGRGAEGLQAAAAYAVTAPFLYGRAADGAVFRRAVPPDDRLRVTALGAALALRNLRHTGVDGLKLILCANLRSAGPVARVRAAIRALAAEIAGNGLQPHDLSVELTGLADAQTGVAVAALQGLRERGVGIAFKEQGEGLAANGLPDALTPDLVRIDGGWFRAVARQAATARLFKALVQAYQSRGVLVLVDGIATVPELWVASDCGADLLAGDLLAPAALAGAVFPDRASSVDPLVAEPRVIPLFR